MKTLSYNQPSALQVAEEKHAVEVLMFSQKKEVHLTHCNYSGITPCTGTFSS